MGDYKDYVSKQLLTYLGNKRKLLRFIEETILNIRNNDDDLKNKKLVIFDGFSGTGVVSRMMKKHSSKIYVNDYELYSYVTNKAFLPDKDKKLLEEIKYWIDKANKIKLNYTKQRGFIAKNYAPVDDNNIKEGERVFFTSYNAKIIDNVRLFIEKEVPEHIKDYILAELIQKASVHNNTSGVFKGFHKKDGIGHFGGKGEYALSRIMKEITLEYPVYYNTGTEINIYKGDTKEIIKQIPEKLDITYYDPPYNQHPYGSNYGMLNLIIKNGGEIQEKGVSGIPKEWYKSAWNKKQQAIKDLEELIKNTNSKYIMFSYNNEGIIPAETFKKTLEKYGEVEKVEQDYNAYRGSRNLNKRNTYVKEILWILKK